jgi:MYXO-CTERM domain-containing protein
MIAQQVEEVFPEWVGTDADGYKTLTYRGFEALTVESLREIEARSAKLETENKALAGKVASLEERLAALEKRGGPQHASVTGSGPWPFAVLFGAALGAPLWLRRRRKGAAAS